MKWDKFVQERKGSLAILKVRVCKSLKREICNKSRLRLVLSSNNLHVIVVGSS